MMRGWRTLVKAMLLGFVRDRAAVFFTIAFPLLLLVLIGGLFRDEGTARVEVLEVGAVTLLDELSPPARGQLDEVLSITEAGDLELAIRSVRQGDAAAVVEQPQLALPASESGRHVQDAVAQGGRWARRVCRWPGMSVLR